MLCPKFFMFHFCKFFILCLILFSTCSANAAPAPGTYSIVLASTAGKNIKWNYNDNIVFSGRSFFVEKMTIKGAPWERLNIGFYRSRKQASSTLKEVRKLYPGAWVIQTPADAKKFIIHTVPNVFKGSIRKNSSSLSEKQLSSLMRRAKNDLKNKKFSSAIRYLTAVVNAGNHRYSSEALELLGLARQRNGQNAHAVVVYERYLKLYPDNKGSVRVEQRLTGLLTAASAPRKKIRMLSNTKKISETRTFGSLSQFYRGNIATVDGGESIKTLSQLISFVDIRTTHRTNKFDHRYQFTSDHVFDFISDENKDEFRFIETYYELSHRATGSSATIGRQALRIGGLYNRFDGITAGYQFTPNMRINLLAGFPVEIEDKSSINENKTFYGITYESGTFYNNWNMNVFYFDQKYNSFTDRTSIGTEVFYNNRRQSFFGMIDYNLLFDEVNLLQFNGNMRFEQGMNVFINAFMRKGPILATSNALVGQQQTTLKELAEQNPGLNIEQIYQLAKDRTANNETITAGGSKRLNLNYQATADITVSKTGSTPASAGVPATEELGPYYFISTQLVGNNLFSERDTNVLGIRYSDTDPSTTISIIANSRLPITREWRINPRLQFDIRDSTDNRSQNRLRAFVRTDYTYQNKARFDLEIGYDKIDDTNSGLSLSNNSLFFTVGYRWNF